MISTGSLAAFSASAIPNLQRPAAPPATVEVAARRPAEAPAAPASQSAPGSLSAGSGGAIPVPNRLTPRGSLLDLSV